VGGGEGASVPHAMPTRTLLLCAQVPLGLWRVCNPPLPPTPLFTSPLPVAFIRYFREISDRDEQISRMEEGYAHRPSPPPSHTHHTPHPCRVCLHVLLARSVFVRNICLLSPLLCGYHTPGQLCRLERSPERQSG
jgi:hypothetical protein